jgi:stress-induced morphogen
MAPLTETHIHDRIVAALPGARVLVTDYTGTGDHFRAEVAYAGFAGKSRVEQHRMVYDAVREEMADGSLHALSLATSVAE